MKYAITPVAGMLELQDTLLLTHNLDPEMPIQWRTTNPQVAVVDETGLVRAVGNGEAFIVAKYGAGILSCRITVGHPGGNPILPHSWGLFVADCEPHVFGDTVYIFGSKDAPDGFMPDGTNKYCTKEYHVIYSKDLIHWFDAGVSLRLDNIDPEMTNGADRLWAPDIFQCPQTGKYYLTACTNTRRYLLLEAASPIGPFVNPKVMTIHGEPIDEIDPSVLVDDDGKVYLAFPNFYIAQLDPSDYSRVLPETIVSMLPWMPQDNEPFEGPSLKKNGNVYYYIYIQNHGKKADGWVPTRMAYLTAKSPLGPYTYAGVIVRNHNYLASTNIHGSIFCWKEQWYAAYHMPVAQLRRTRTPFIDPIHINSDGTIAECPITSSGVKEAFLPGERIPAASAVVFSGGRGDVRLQIEPVPATDEPYRVSFPAPPYLWLEQPGQYAGWRYLCFTEDVKSVALRFATQSTGATLSVCIDSPDGETLARCVLPDTCGEWRQMDFPLLQKTADKHSVWISLAQPPCNGRVKIDWFSFSRSHSNPQ